ncbi:Y4yA family PLP-dependent enzyme [Gaiella sp.]|uniref:Y4yA family PLP-dependent enzyme n=1 Tax=Gaiella sp. TaxID=2663207 RepID=UPI00326619F9
MNRRIGDPHVDDLRSRCAGVVALPARLEPWQTNVCRQPMMLAGWLDRYGSPLNLLDSSPVARNVGELMDAAAKARVDLKIYFARKANKALTFVERAHQLGLGVDVASEQELGQTLDLGVSAADIVVSAAVKPTALLDLCASSGATVVIDNEDELRLLIDAARRFGQNVPVAPRLAPQLAGRQTRFGLTTGEILAMVDRLWAAGVEQPLTIVGVHFHLDGYDAAERVSALAECVQLIEALRARGHRPTFIDIGGGIPMSYFDDARDWDRFWSDHRAAVLGRREPLTFEGHGLGLTAHAGEVLGQPNLYPYYQDPIRGPWLTEVLTGTLGLPRGAEIAADALRIRGLQLRCEPGRSLLDGCGLTAARVEFRKRWHDGTWLIGLMMNRTQCRSSSDEFLVDPLLLRAGGRGDDDVEVGPIEGYLVGAYCIERDLLSWRRMRFPMGVDVGDIVVFPNTAGYLMHILESTSHQMPLARNLVFRPGEQPLLDAIDRVGPYRAGHGGGAV